MGKYVFGIALGSALFLLNLALSRILPKITDNLWIQSLLVAVCNGVIMVAFVKLRKFKW